MKRKHFLSCGFLILAIIIMSGVTHAENFIFNVPVELHKIPSDIKYFQIMVQVGNKDNQLVAYGMSTEIPIVNGEHVGTVTVTDNLKTPSPVDPATATKYEAVIYLQMKKGYKGDNCDQIMNLNGYYPYDPTKPHVCDVHGAVTIPLKSAPKGLGKPTKTTILK